MANEGIYVSSSSGIKAGVMYTAGNTGRRNNGKTLDLIPKGGIAKRKEQFDEDRGRNTFTENEKRIQNGKQIEKQMQIENIRKIGNDKLESESEIENYEEETEVASGKITEPRQVRSIYSQRRGFGQVIPSDEGDTVDNEWSLQRRGRSKSTGRQRSASRIRRSGLVAKPQYHTRSTTSLGEELLAYSPIKRKDIIRRGRPARSGDTTNEDDVVVDTHSRRMTPRSEGHGVRIGRIGGYVDRRGGSSHKESDEAMSVGGETAVESKGKDRYKEKAVSGKEKDRLSSYEGMWIRKDKESLSDSLANVRKVNQEGRKLGSASVRYNSIIKVAFNKPRLCRWSSLKNSKGRKISCQLLQLLTLSVFFSVNRSKCMLVVCFFLVRRPLYQSLCLFVVEVSYDIWYAKSKSCLVLSFIFFSSPSSSLDASVLISSFSFFFLVMYDLGGYYLCLLPASLSFFLLNIYVRSFSWVGRQVSWWKVLSNLTLNSPSRSVILISCFSLRNLLLLYDAELLLLPILPASLSVFEVINFCSSGGLLTGYFQLASLSSLTSIYISVIHFLEFILDLWLGSCDHHWQQVFGLWVLMGIQFGRWTYNGKKVYCLGGLMNWEGYRAKCSVRTTCRKGKERKDSCIYAEIGVVRWRCGVEYKQESRTICVEEEKVNEIVRKKKGRIAWVINLATELCATIYVKWGERRKAKLVRIKIGHRKKYSVKTVKGEERFFEIYTLGVILERVCKKLNGLMGRKKVIVGSSEKCKVSTIEISLNFRKNNGSNKGRKLYEGWEYVLNWQFADNSKDSDRREDVRKVLFICKVRYILNKDKEYVKDELKRRVESRYIQYSRMKDRVCKVLGAEVSVSSLENGIVSKRESCEKVEFRTVGDDNKHKRKRKVNELGYNMDRYCKNSGHIDYSQKGKGFGNGSVDRNCTKRTFSVSLNLVEKNCSEDNKNSVCDWKVSSKNHKCCTADRRHILIGKIDNKVDRNEMEYCRGNIEHITRVRDEEIITDYSDTDKIKGSLTKIIYNRQLGNRINVNKYIVMMNIPIGNLHKITMASRNCRSRMNIGNIDSQSKDRNHWKKRYMTMIYVLRWKVGRNIRDWQEVMLLTIRENIDPRRWGLWSTLRVTHGDLIEPNTWNWKEYKYISERFRKYQNVKGIKKSILQQGNKDLLRCLIRKDKSILVGLLYEKDGRNRCKVTNLDPWKKGVYNKFETGMRLLVYIRIKGDSKSQLEFKVASSVRRTDVMFKNLGLRWNRKELVMLIWLSRSEINNDPIRNYERWNWGRCGKDTKPPQKWKSNAYDMEHKLRMSRLMYCLGRSSFLACKPIRHVCKTCNTSLDKLQGVILAKARRGNINRKSKWDAVIVALSRLQAVKLYPAKHLEQKCWTIAGNSSINKNVLIIGDVKFNKWIWAYVWMREIRCVRRRVAIQDFNVCPIRLCCRTRISYCSGILCSEYKMKIIKINNIKEMKMLKNEFQSYYAKAHWKYFQILIKAEIILWILNANHKISYRNSWNNTARMGIVKEDKMHITESDLWRSDSGEACSPIRNEKERTDTQDKIESLTANG